MVPKIGCRRRNCGSQSQILWLRLSALIATLTAGTAETLSAVAATAAEVSTYGSNLRPASELTDNCFNFPEVNFDPANSIKGVYGSSPHMMMEIGDRAIDFTVHDVDGKAWNLREALQTGEGKPVVLIWGMFTCPAFEGMGTSPPWEKCGYWHERDLVEDYKDRAIFVHLYVAEPHPTYPGVNFDKGKMVDNYWSTVKQHRSYQDRLEIVNLVRHLIHPAQVILPEYFPGNPYSDLIHSVWCSYALGARPAVVISPDGIVIYQQTWLQTEHVAVALESFWAGEEVQPEETSSLKTSRKSSSRRPTVANGEAGSSKTVRGDSPS